MTQNEKLGNKKIGALLFEMAIPAITAQLVNMLYNIIDRVYIGHIPGEGAAALTGLGLCFPVIILIMAFGNLIGMGGGPLISIKLGEKNAVAAEKIMGNCITALVVIALILTGVFLAFGRPLLFLFGASDQTIPYALQYLNIYVLGTVFVMFTLGINPFITAQGFSKISMLTTLIGAVANIILDPIFIFGFGMGVRGAALATILSQCLSAVWIFRFLNGKKTILKLRRRNLRPVMKYIQPVLFLGISPFIMSATESVLNICFNSSLQRYGGDLAVGTMTILSSVMQILTLPLNGLGQGAQPIISYNYGAKQYRRVKQVLIYEVAVSFLYCILFWGVNMRFPSLIPSFFAESEQLREMAAWASPIYLGGCFMFCIQFPCQMAFVALGKAKVSLFLAVLRKILLLIPFIYLFPVLVSDQVFGVFLAEPVADVLAALTTGTLFLISFRKLPKTSGNE